MYKHIFTNAHPYTFKYIYTGMCTYTCMHVHTYMYIYTFHSMWTSRTSTRYIWEAEPGVPDEQAFPASLITATSY